MSLITAGVFAILAMPLVPGCATAPPGTNSSVASEIQTIQDIQIGGDAAAAAAILYAGFTGNQTLAAQIAADQQNFDTLCASGIADVQSGTNAGFASIEANLAALAKSIEQSFAGSTPVAMAASTTNPPSIQAIRSARASLAAAQAKVVAAKAKYPAK